MGNWILYNVALPIALPSVLGILTLVLASQSYRILSLFRDGSLLMYCILTAFDFIKDMQSAIREGASNKPNDLALVSCLFVIAISCVVYGNNIRVDENEVEGGAVRETIAASGTLVLALILIIYYRYNLNIF